MRVHQHTHTHTAAARERAGILRDKLKLAELMLAATIESAPRAGDGREAYYCNDQGCWVAQQYFCDETGCWITEAPAQALERTFNGDSAPQALGSGAPAPQKAIVQEGISPYPPTPTPLPLPLPYP